MTYQIKIWIIFIIISGLQYKKKVQLRPSGMQYVLLLLQMLKSMFRGENFSLYFLICWFIRQILTPTFTFFLLLSHFFRLSLQHVTHVTNDANVTNVMRGCALVSRLCTVVRECAQVCAVVCRCTWMWAGVCGWMWVCAGMCGTPTGD